MTVNSNTNYSVLDRPEVLMFLFHPRAESGVSVQAETAEDILIPVDEGIAIGARFHLTGKNGPSVLFFHGNGEIVSDYDGLGPMYNQLGINFLPVDYRGYGRSNGEPSVSTMMQDCHVIFEFVKNWLKENGYGGPLVCMGRSLGSASALELAACYEDAIDVLVIESGFALAGPLLKLLGIDVTGLGFEEEKGFANIDKIERFHKPTLIIHAEHDHIIPYTDGQALYHASAAEQKQLLKIPGADHNTIFMRGLSQYLAAIQDLIQGLPG